MANAPQIDTENGFLVSERDKLAEFLKQYGNVKLAGVQGEPPRKYEVEFNMRAYTPDEDGIAVGRNHRIQITLLPGYPKVAPQVEALTPLYHPALDEDDDCFSVAEAWAKHPSLTELILHLVDLLTGRLYKIAKPVNAGAIEWYEEHKKELPLDSLAKSNKEQESLLGMLEDDDFNPAVNMEEEIPEEDPMQYQDQIQEIRMLLEQNQLYLLSKRLKDLPAGLWFPERDEARERVENAQQETKKLFSMAKEQEEAKDYRKAMEYASAILELIPDHPDAKALVQRLQNSSFITDSLADALAERDHAAHSQQTWQPDSPTAETVPPPPPTMAWLPEDFPVKRIIAGVLAGALVFWLFTVTLNELSVLDRVQRGIREAQAANDIKQYAAAKETLERVQKNLGDLHLLFFKKGALNTQIEDMLTDPTLVSGAKGHVKYKGKYVVGTLANALEEMARLEKEAAEQEQQGLYGEAARTYAQALRELIGQALPEEEKRLQSQLGKMEVRHLLQQADQEEQKNRWDYAEDYYRKATARLQENSELARDFEEVVQQARIGLKVRQTVEQAFNALDRNRPDAAKTYLNQAEKLASSLTQASEHDKILLESLKVQVQMLEVLVEAKQAYEQKDWKKADKLYQKALRLVEGSSSEVRQSLQEYAVQVALRRDLARVHLLRREAASAASQGKQGKAANLEQEALALLNNSRYAANGEVARLKREIGGQMSRHQKTASEQDRIKDLERRSGSYLSKKDCDVSSPKAVFVRKDGSRMIYELSCLNSSGGGRASKIALRFAYDERTGQWSQMRN